MKEEKEIYTSDLIPAVIAICGIGCAIIAIIGTAALVLAPIFGISQRIYLSLIGG